MLAVELEQDLLPTKQNWCSNISDRTPVTGVATATTFSGNATSATTATNAQGLTGTPNITVGSVVGTAVGIWYFHSYRFGRNSR